MAGMGYPAAWEHQECAICFSDLALQPCVRLCNRNGSNICKHTFHHLCLTDLPQPWTCPLCRQSFQRMEVIPQVTEDPRAWFDFMDTDHSGSLTYDEIIDGLKSQMKLDWFRIEADVDRLFGQWDTNKDGTISFSEFSNPSTGVMKYLSLHYAARPRPSPPDIRKEKDAWFDYWDEDHSGQLDKDEIARALVKTFQLFHVDQQAVTNTLEVIWPIFDTDDSGKIDRAEFLSPDNLADSVIAQLAIA
jgi:Ca2+-binding EF-hand superfamily protein